MIGILLSVVAGKSRTANAAGRPAFRSKPGCETMAA
jgi:hypothetical protein